MAKPTNPTTRVARECFPVKKRCPKCRGKPAVVVCMGCLRRGCRHYLQARGHVNVITMEDEGNRVPFARIAHEDGLLPIGYCGCGPVTREAGVANVLGFLKKCIRDNAPKKRKRATPTKRNASRFDAAALKRAGGPAAYGRSQAENAYDQRGGTETDEDLYYAAHENLGETMFEWGFDCRTARGKKAYDTAEVAFNIKFRRLFGSLPYGC